jgi:hypothetical protein
MEDCWLLVQIIPSLRLSPSGSWKYSSMSFKRNFIDLQKCSLPVKFSWFFKISVRICIRIHYAGIILLIKITIIINIITYFFLVEVKGYSRDNGRKVFPEDLTLLSLVVGDVRIIFVSELRDGSSTPVYLLHKISSVLHISNVNNTHAHLYGWK